MNEHKDLGHQAADDGPVPSAASEDAARPVAGAAPTEQEAPLVKRSKRELEAMPKPQSPAELEVLSRWYFGRALHLSKLWVYGGANDAIAGGAQYKVDEPYNSYHGTGWLHTQSCIHGYDYSSAFWAFVIGHLYCGGIAGHSYGQAHVVGHRDVLRLKRFEVYLRRKESGRLRGPFERLAREYGAGENTATRDSRVQIAGRVDGAAAVSSRVGEAA